MRQRIVINLGAPEGVNSSGGPAAGRRTLRRWPRVLAILGGLVLLFVVAAAAGGFLWWRHYQSTPAYTLALLIDAAQRNDVAEFQKRIDDDEVAKNMLGSVSQKAAGRYGFAMSPATQQRIDAVMPSLLPRAKQTIHDELAKELKAFAATTQQKPFIFLVLAIPSLMTITTEGDTAKLTGKLNERMVELAMRRDVDRWKVTDYKDEVVVQRVVDSMMKDLPAIGPVDPNSPLLKKWKPGRRGR